MPFKSKAPLLASAAGVGMLALRFSLSPLLRSAEAADLSRGCQTDDGSVKAAVVLDPGPERGRRLFNGNCTHCHGDDARGDEGPSLYSLTMSNARIAKRIKEGLKGEMPRFGSKFSDADIAALTAYLRTLKD